MCTILFVNVDEYVVSGEAKLCHPNPCKNGAQCKENIQGGYDCLCAAGYSGAKCEGTYST